ncbi:MAG: molybdate ABC transporter permease subunit [Deltaproteobacteria bacterium]|nr:molybdate ABC transporter permease subunit [Deltaproteobacteria bacterium]
MELLASINWTPFLLSLKLASVTTVVLLLLATPIAYLLAFGRFRGRTIVEAILALPIVLPPTVLGFFILVAIGNLSPIGQLYNDLFGRPLAFTFLSLVIASVLYSFPFAVQPIQNAFRSVNPRFVEASRTLGCTRWQSFWRVLIPSSRAGLITGAMLSFAHTVGEFGVVLMVGGSIPGETKVASIAIYEEVEKLNYVEASVMAFVLLIFSFVILSGVYYFNRKSSRTVFGW